MGKRAERGTDRPDDLAGPPGRSRPRQLPDFHLWHEVAATITPLVRARLAPASRPGEHALPAPAGPDTKPRKAPFARTMPSYQSAGLPGRPPGRGIEPKRRRKLQRGRIEIEATLDLHGMRQAEARAALARFLHARVARGDRTVLVITGKGLKKLGPDAAVIVEAGVLRSMLPVWLAEESLAPIIAGWEPAAQGHGGEGAFYVRLRRAAALAR